MLDLVLSNRMFLIYLMAGTFAVGWIMYVYFLLYLRKHHSDSWHALGELSIVENKGALRASVAVTGFVLQRRHRELGDRFLSRLCDALLIYFIIASVVLGVGLVRLIVLDQSSTKRSSAAQPGPDRQPAVSLGLRPALQAGGRLSPAR
jgi:hypothetical protein